MNKRKRTQDTTLFILNAIEIILLCIIFVSIWKTKYISVIYFYRKGYWVLFFIYVSVLSMLNSLFGGFNIGVYKKEDLIFSQIFSLIITNLITYLQVALIDKKFLDYHGFLYIMIIQIIVVFITVIIEYKIYYSIFPPKKTLVLYNGEYTSITNRICKYQTQNFNITEKIKLNHNLNEIKNELFNYECILSIGVSPEDKNNLIKFCYQNSISVYIIPSIYDLIINNATKFHLIDSPMLIANNFGPSQLEKIIKRLIDILISLVGLILSSPIWVITAIAIKLYDHGPIIYSQNRLTQYGKVFKIYKFRSMRTDAEKDGVARFAKENDSRITPIGKFIRACRIDEIPQLFNILKGDMSFVGPRPERPEIAEQFKKDVPEFDYRLKVKAGLTGYAQIYGKYNTPLKDKLMLDLMYIENYSIILDIKLIIMTVKIIFMKDSTEGVEN